MVIHPWRVLLSFYTTGGEILLFARKASAKNITFDIITPPGFQLNKQNAGYNSYSSTLPFSKV